MNPALTVVLVIAAVALCAAGVWAALRLAAAADSLRRLSDDLDTRLPALLDKADVTVDALNAELLRVDLIVTQVEEVADKVTAASQTVHNVLNVPHEVVNEVSDKLRRGMKNVRRRRERDAGLALGPPRGSELSVEADERPAPVGHDAGD